MVTLADIPFQRRPTLPLLGLTPDSARGDDFDEHGWCRPSHVWLDDGTTRRRVDAPLLIAVHTPDELEPGPLTLALWFTHDGESIAARVSWQRFSSEVLPPLLGPETDVVLALCNPGHKPVPAPLALGARTLHFAHGDVTAWLDNPADPEPRAPDIRLTAEQWRTCHVADHR